MAPNTHQNPAPIDLRGVPCPLNWARAKVVLEGMARGARLALLVDDPRSPRDLPLAAESEGYCVISVLKEPDGATRIVIER